MYNKHNLGVTLKEIPRTTADRVSDNRNCRQTSLCSVFVWLSTLFQLSWFEVLSGATVLAVTMTVLNYQARTSTRHLETVNLPHKSTNQENGQDCCNSIFSAHCSELVLYPAR